MDLIKKELDINYFPLFWAGGQCGLGISKGWNINTLVGGGEDHLGPTRAGLCQAQLQQPGLLSWWHEEGKRGKELEQPDSLSWL